MTCPFLASFNKKGFKLIKKKCLHVSSSVHGIRHIQGTFKSELEDCDIQNPNQL